MTSEEINAEQRAVFLATVVRQASFYCHFAISYVAIKRNDEKLIVAATLDMSPWPLPKFRPYESNHWVADRSDLDCIDLSTVIDEAMSGTINIPGGQLVLPHEPQGTTLNQNRSKAYRNMPAVLRVPGCQTDKLVPYIVTEELNAGTLCSMGKFGRGIDLQT